jgi:hypothetical protein
MACPEHGVVQVAIPWAEPHGRFTMLFERFATWTQVRGILVRRSFDREFLLRAFYVSRSAARIRHVRTLNPDGSQYDTDVSRSQIDNLLCRVEQIRGYLVRLFRQRIYRSKARSIWWEKPRRASWSTLCILPMV